MVDTEQIVLTLPSAFAKEVKEYAKKHNFLTPQEFIRSLLLEKLKEINS